MLWYNTNNLENYKSNVQNLINKDKLPLLQQLLEDQSFTLQLKNLNPKLIQFINNNPHYVFQMLTLIIEQPQITQNSNRIHKHPFLSIQAFETQSLVLLNTLFKPHRQYTCMLDYLFSFLQKDKVNSLLAGYFLRLIYVLVNMKHNQIFEYIYQRQQIMENMINKIDQHKIMQVLTIFINIDATKDNYINQNRLKTKLKILVMLFKHLKNLSVTLLPNQFYQQFTNVQQLISQTVQKYFLISHGKQMIDFYLEQQQISLFFNLIQSTNTVVSMPILRSLSSLIVYISTSVYNNQQQLQIQHHKQVLQNMSLVRNYIYKWDYLFNKIKKGSLLNLQMGILQFLINGIRINSYLIFQKIISRDIFGILLEHFFTKQNHNIFHMQVQRLFFHIFSTPKIIYQRYKQYFFCQFDIIRRTTFFLQKNINIGLNDIKNKGYFGHLVNIIKIYSSLQTNNNKIVQAISKKGQLWATLSKNILNPHNQILIKKLGEMECSLAKLDVSKVSVKRMDTRKEMRKIQSVYPQQNIQVKSLVEQEIDKLEQNPPSDTHPLSQPLPTIQKIDQNKVQPPLQFKQNFMVDEKKEQALPFFPSKAPLMQSAPSNSQIKNQDKANQQKKEQALDFTKYYENQKIQIQNKQRMNRHKRSTTPRKSKSPSPISKRQKWSNKQDDDTIQKPSLPKKNRDSSRQKHKKQIKQQNDESNKLAQSDAKIIQNSKRFSISNEQQFLSKSSITFDRIKVVVRSKQNMPIQKKYRKIEQKDRKLLDLLQIKYN